MSEQWYFAYGSNLLREQMVKRTKENGEARRARLDGYRLVFNKQGGDGTGKANIIPDHGGTVWGAVYRCSPNALNDLDRCEGVSGGHYTRKKVRVRVDSGEAVEAIAYMAGNQFINNELRPSQEYLEIILRGAREHDLPDEYIRRLEMWGN
ncbi:MAG: gamma-glutamylcyclotransferase [Nitrospira sp.]|nr:gamma-glutamylcyclotransferase [Nitrospira sp.]